MSQGSLDAETWEQEARDAMASGFKVLMGATDLLLVDLDGPTASAQFDLVLPLVVEHFAGVVVLERHASSTPGHEHVVLTCERAAHDARVFLQVALGSDPVREVLSVARRSNGVEEPGRLFIKWTPTSSRVREAVAAAWVRFGEGSEKKTEGT